MKQRTEQEGRKLVSQFRASGRTQQAYAKKSGVNLSSLQYWISRVRRMEECTEHQRFVEIEMSSQLDGDVLRMEWKEMRMSFGKLPDARWLSEFLTLFGA